jgi:hypothetical protein
MKSITNLIILFVILIALVFLYRRFEDKRLREENNNNNNEIQKYLLNSETLGKSTKPILWIHVPYEYNSRQWLSFGSRSTFDLNQPYLYLTARSIIRQCDQSFTICIIDDKSFEKLIPEWNIDMSKISSPIVNNVRTLGLMKLIYIYGGMVCPISFLCMRDLFSLYEKGTINNQMFVCETVDRNITATEFNFYPNIMFCGANKECPIVMELCNYIAEVMSKDSTAESVFLGDFNTWLNKKANSNQIMLIDGREIGTKTMDDTPILLDHLMSNYYLDIYPNTYGIFIPSARLLNRIKFEWFARLSERQVLESNTIIGNYILLYSGKKEEEGVLEPLQVKQDWVGFWKTPLYPGLYGLKPNFLGDNLLHLLGENL